jgi:hypothetical protein
VSPPWVCKPRLQMQCDEFLRFACACAECIPRGAYAPRSWLLHDRSPVENRLLRCTNAHPVRSGGRQPAVVRDTNAVPRQSSIVRRPTNGRRRGAAGVSPPWFVTPTLYRENRVSSRDRRTDNEEGRALARRGFVNRVCKCNATNFRVSRAHARSPFHGGLTPPRSWLHTRVSSRMRGCALQRRFVCHGAAYAPALNCCTIVRPWKTAFCHAQTHIRSRAAGVSPPWFVIPTPYRENRASFRDRRTDNEERRA